MDRQELLGQGYREVVTEDQFNDLVDSGHLNIRSDSRRNLEQLKEDVFEKKEIKLFWDEKSGEVVRYNGSVNVDVFYENSLGRKYKLKEGSRNKLPAGKTIVDFLADDSIATSVPGREVHNSISERMKMGSVNPETSKDAALRALIEELFSLPGEYNEEDVRQYLSEKLTYIGNRRVVRSKDDPDNSYAGITSILDVYVYGVTFDDKTPFVKVEEGIPQRLYEYIPEKGYLNVFEWEEI